MGLAVSRASPFVVSAAIPQPQRRVIWPISRVTRLRTPADRASAPPCRRAAPACKRRRALLHTPGPVHREFSGTELTDVVTS